jgi:single-stranded DNA-binding protein
MTEAAVRFAGNLTDDPEVRSTEGGIARARFRAGEVRVRSFSTNSRPALRAADHRPTEPNVSAARRSK